jgi:hypothetical protein
VRNHELRRVAPKIARRTRVGVAFDPPDVESRLVALACAEPPLRRALARLAGRMERLRGWERIGWARRRDYATERLGISGRRLQELARMDRAFDGLPSLEYAFVSGRVSWTKARLLARVATPEDAEAWITHAASVTAHELSREVRALDARARDLLRPETDEDGEGDGDDKETVFVHCTTAVRAKWHRARFLASRLEGHPVPAWAVAERLAAETLSALPLDAPALERIEVERAQSEAPDTVESRPSASRDLAAITARLHQESPNGCAGQDSEEPLRSPVRVVGKHAGGASPNECAHEVSLFASFLEGLDQTDAFEVDARLRRALAAEQRLIATMGPWLLALARGRLYRAYGCSSLAEFAREWLGISASKADALVRLERTCQIAPPLREAFRAGRLSWAQAQILVPLLRRENTVRWHEAWVGHAERVSVRRLVDEVSQALALGSFEPPPLGPPDGSWADGRETGGGDPDAVETAQVADSSSYPHPQTGARPSYFPRTMAFFFTGPRDVARLFRGALATVQRRIERRNGRTASESEALEAILEHAFETWELASGKLKREHRVFDRDNWRCTFPGCTSYGNLQDHHIEYRSHGGSNALSNRTTLCVWHHQRGEHAKVVRCRGMAPGRLRFDLGLRVGRPPLARYRSGDVRGS